MSRWRAIITTACALALVSVVPTMARAGTPVLPPQCSDPNANLYNYPPSVAKACGFTVVPLDHIVNRPDGGQDYVYVVNGRDAVMPKLPANFDPLSATAAQLSYYGYPPRPSGDTSVAAWAKQVTTMRIIPPSRFLIEDVRKSAATLCSPIDLCWGGYVATGASFNQSYIDYTEPGEAQSSCSNDAVLNWTGLGGFTALPLGQDGTAPFFDNKAHFAWHEVYNDAPFTFWSLQTRAGDDIQAHVYWLSGSSEFKMTLTDTTLNQSVSPYYYSPPGGYDDTSAEFIVERPQSDTYIYPLRNFYTGWTVKAAQANNIGMQNFTLHKENIYNKSSKLLESTGSNSGQSFGASWVACG